MTATDDLPLAVQNLIDLPADGGLPRLMGSRCTACGHYAYPSVGICCECGGATEAAGLGRKGIIYSYTSVHVKPPMGLPSPYSVAYIDLNDTPLRIFGLLAPGNTTPYAIGQRVELRVGQIGVNIEGQPCLRPYFAPDISSPA